MENKKVKQFMKLAGQETATKFVDFSKFEPKVRELGAQLLLSETLEYVIKGLNVTPKINGIEITDPNSLEYVATSELPDKLEMLDGLSDVAYTMFWNMHRFGIPLEEAYELVCDNNLEKFVRLSSWDKGELTLDEADWDLGMSVTWPSEVATVCVMEVDGEFFAVGKDKTGKVRKPSTYASVELNHLVS